jgi:type IV secretory pathway VirB10-like protein
MLVCELDELPKDGRKLQHAIHEFWSARKKHNLLVFACFNMAFWVVYTWLFWLPGQTPPAPALADAAPVVVVEGAPAPGATGAELPTATPAPAPPVPAYPAPPAGDQAAPVVAVAVEEGAPTDDQAAAPAQVPPAPPAGDQAAPAGPRPVYLPLIVRSTDQ